MFSCVIVDDEETVIEGILEHIDWHGLGITVTGTASDGDEGVELICDQRPDIVISDIRMPTIDGLEMCRIVRNADLFPQVILISGYADHTYARQALSLSAVDYILKPFHPDDLHQVLANCVERLRERQPLAEQSGASHPESLLARLLSDQPMPLSVDERDRMRDQCLLPAGSCYLLVVVQHEQVEGEQPDAEEDTFFSACRAFIVGYLTNPEHASLRNRVHVVPAPRTHRVVVVVSGSNSSALIDSSTEFTAALRERFARETGCNVVCGLSEISDDPAILNELYLHARKALHCCFFDRSVSVQRFNLLDRSIGDDRVNVLPEQIAARLRAGDQRGCQQAMSTLFLHFTLNETDVFARLKLECMRTCRSIAVTLPEDAFSDRSRTEEAEELILKSQRFREVYDAMLDLISDLTERSGADPRKVDSVVHRALAYIHAHLSDPITISEVAAHVHLSDSRFSVKFSQVVGEPFSRYVARRRIEQAMALLREQPHLKVYEVGERIGYPNPQYFGTLFKKYVGLTPHQFIVTQT